MGEKEIMGLREEPTEISNPRFETVAYLAARGLSPKEIGDALGLSTPAINALLTQERMRFEIKVVRHKLFGKEHQKAFRELLPHAIDATKNVLLDPTSKPSTRLDAAKEVMDRTLGKPKQTIEHEGSLLRELVERLDKKKIIDVESAATVDAVLLAPLVEPNPNQILTAKEIDAEKGIDSAQRWVDENL